MSAIPEKETRGNILAGFTVGEADTRQQLLADCNRRFARRSTAERIRWSLQQLPGQHVMSSSFGAQAAVTLHLLTEQYPNIPVILIDTGYLFAETYRFIDKLNDRLKLNLTVSRADLSPAWQEARHGARWEHGEAGINAYNDENKVAPMKKALRELDAGTWFAGLRRSQSQSREMIPFLEWSGSRWKVHPIADWTDRDVHHYLKQHDLPYHPLWEKGYVSIGDHHTTKSLHDVDDKEKTRFFGVKRECGLHEFDLSTV